MSSRMAYYFAAFALALAFNTILLVKAQPTMQDCQNGDSLNRIATELNVEGIHHLNEQVHRMRALLSESFQQMKDQHASAMRRLEVAIQLLLYHDISIKNQTQNSWKLAFGVPLPLEIGVDLGDGFVLLPSINNWVITMNRFDGSVNFNRNWTEYRNGFGDMGGGEFWLGNEIVHRLTNRIGAVYALRIEVQLDTSGRWLRADYATFSLDSDDNKYALRLSGFSGNSGDPLTNTSVPLWNHGNMSFSTSDNNNDGSPSRVYNCAKNFEAGWWFNYCVLYCLTCPYDKSTFKWPTSQSDGKLRAARMMIKSR